jgi:hypothetical protein
MRLKQGQKKKLLEWVGEGLRTDEINKRASELDDPFAVTRSQVDYYRDTRKIKLENIKDSNENDALTTGLAIRSVRVQKLQVLADKLENDLIKKDLTWVTEPRVLGNTYIEVEKFNASEVREYREIIDQIAGEVGDKKPDTIIPDHVHVTFGKPPDAKDA